PDRLIDLIVHNEAVPAVNQIETHPFNQQIETQKFLEESNVQIESWGPFAEGRNNIFENELLLSIAEVREDRRPGNSALANTKGSGRHPEVGQEGKDCRKLRHLRFRTQPRRYGRDHLARHEAKRFLRPPRSRNREIDRYCKT